MAQDIDFSGKATKTDQRRLKGEARSGDQLLADTYEQGRREGRSERPARFRSRRRVPRPSPRARAALFRSVRDPAGSSSLIQLLGLTLAVVALYTVLVNADHASGALGAVGRALRWLSDPGTSIPYTTAPD